MGVSESTVIAPRVWLLTSSEYHCFGCILPGLIKEITFECLQALDEDLEWKVSLNLCGGD